MMPCICYGATSGKEEIDRFLKTHDGKMSMASLKYAALLIKEFRQSHLDRECIPDDFNKAFIECFTHLITKCNEKEDE